MDGLETARRLSALISPPRVVFITAYDEYALQAFELAAVDYLLKPVDPERLDQTLSRLQSNTSDTGAELRKLLGALTLRRLALLDEATGVRHVIDMADIVYAYCEDEKTYVRLRGRLLRSMDTLAGLEGRLCPQQFMRVHRSHIVNLQKVLRVEPWGAGTFNLELEGSDRAIPLSRQHAAAFKEKVGWA
jgi:DNA-binding LytR/AlgR family response regulator